MICLSQSISFPGSREIEHASVAGRQQDARRDCSIPPRDRHSGRRTTVPRFESQTEEAMLVALWQASPPKDNMKPVLVGIFFLSFGGGISCVPSRTYARQ